MADTLARTQQRRGATAEWESVDPILLEGEVGYDTDEKRLKVGDGTSPWTALPYWNLTTADIDAGVTDALEDEDSDASQLLTSTYVKIANRPETLYGRDGIYFNGTASVAGAVQDALDDIGPGRQIDLGPNGRLRPGGPIAIPNYSTLVGTTEFFAAGTSAAAEIIFPELSSGAAVSLGIGSRMKEVLVRGPGFSSSVIGIRNYDGDPGEGARVVLEDVQVYDCGRGILLEDAYYVSMERCEFRFNTIGLDLYNCTKVVLVDPRFSCRNQANNVFGTGIRTGSPSTPAQPLSVVGGSFESFGGSGSVAAVVLGADAILNLYGTYFENAVVGAGAVGMIVADRCSLMLEGCLVNLNENNRWVSAAAAVGARIWGRNNDFRCATSSASTPIGYVVGASSFVDVDDQTVGLLKGSHTSVAAGVGHNFPGAGNLRNYGHSIAVPASETIRTGRFTTAGRPSAATVGAGAWAYDTDLGKGIDSNGSVWRERTYSIYNTATLDWPSIPAGSTSEQTMTLTGVAAGEYVIANPGGAIGNGLVWSAYASATDTVVIRLANVTSGAIDPPSATWKVKAIR